LDQAASDCFQDSYTFNDIAGAFSKDTESQIKLYIDLMREEFIETQEAFKNKDSVELLDGVADMFVVLSGLMQIMQLSGFDVDEALQRVALNNLSKFPDDSEHSSDNIPEGCTSEYNSDYGVWVYKNEVGKVKKPNSYKPVYLADLTPVGLFKH
jgi:phosphoribosyl-ATP pyrophosphohydrolase